MRHYSLAVRVGAFALGFALMMLSGWLLFGCGGDIQTLPTLTFTYDGGVDGGGHD